MTETTIHGDNIAAQIANEDAYGDSGLLNTADVREIVDQIHTNLLDNGNDNNTPLMAMITRWLNEAEMMISTGEDASNGR